MYEPKIEGLSYKPMFLRSGQVLSDHQGVALYITSQAADEMACLWMSMRSSRERLKAYQESSQVRQMILENFDSVRYIIYLETLCPLFWELNPLKEGPFQSKQPGHLGFR